MKRIYIYGRGLGYSNLKGCIRDDIHIIAFIDNYTKKIESENGIPIIDKNHLGEIYDYIVISIMKYSHIKNELIERGVSEGKIISFYDYNDAEREEFGEVLDRYKWKTELFWRHMREVVQPFIYNQYYEQNNMKLAEQGNIPWVMTPDETIDYIISGRKSFVRFGDGEFEIIFGRPRPRFQTVNDSLAKRLSEIIRTDDDRILIGIADNYGSLTKYTDEAAEGIRFYMSPSVRKDHMRILDMSKKYGNAYLSRPFFIYRDKSHEVIANKFDRLKKIWRGENILVVEGEHTRFGVGNDLLDKACSIKRILVPNKNAYDFYDEIFSTVKKYVEGRIVLSIIGPTATVLSYDLAKMGYWALDIGQVDTEYEWFLRGAEERCDIPYKVVSEYAEKDYFEQMPEDIRVKYNSEIVETVGI